MYEEKANIEMRRYADGTRNNQGRWRLLLLWSHNFEIRYSDGNGVRWLEIRTELGNVKLKTRTTSSPCWYTPSLWSEYLHRIWNILRNRTAMTVTLCEFFGEECEWHEQWMMRWYQKRLKLHRAACSVKWNVLKMFYNKVIYRPLHSD